MRREVNGRIVAVLSGAASRICPKQREALLYSCYVLISSGIPLDSKWCDHIVVPTQLQLGRISVLFYQRD